MAYPYHPPPIDPDWLEEFFRTTLAQAQPQDLFAPPTIAPPPAAQAPAAAPLDAQTHETLALTIAGEIDPRLSPYDDPATRDEIAQILETINSRQLGGQYGETLADVALAPNQYSTWNTEQARQVALDHYATHGPVIDQAITDYFAGTLPAPIPGATHYYAPAAMQAVYGQAAPYWADNMQPLGQVGAHTFLADPQMMNPQEVAQLQTTLNAMGAELEVDGVYGAATAGAARYFSQQPDGTRNPAVMGLVAQAITPGTAPVAVPGSTMTPSMMAQTQPPVPAESVASVAKLTAPQLDPTLMSPISVADMAPPAGAATSAWAYGPPQSGLPESIQAIQDATPALPGVPAQPNIGMAPAPSVATGQPLPDPLSQIGAFGPGISSTPQPQTIAPEAMYDLQGPYDPNVPIEQQIAAPQLTPDQRIEQAPFSGQPLAGQELIARAFEAAHPDLAPLGSVPPPSEIGISPAPASQINDLAQPAPPISTGISASEIGISPSISPVSSPQIAAAVDPTRPELYPGSGDWGLISAPPPAVEAPPVSAVQPAEYVGGYDTALNAPLNEAGLPQRESVFGPAPPIYDPLSSIMAPPPGPAYDPPPSSAPPPLSASPPLPVQTTSIPGMPLPPQTFSTPAASPAPPAPPPTPTVAGPLSPPAATVSAPTPTVQPPAEEQSAFSSQPMPTDIIAPSGFGATGLAPPMARGFGAPPGWGDLGRALIGGLTGGPIGAIAAPLMARGIGSVQNIINRPSLPTHAVVDGMGNVIGFSGGDGGDGYGGSAYGGGGERRLLVLGRRAWLWALRRA